MATDALNRTRKLKKFVYLDGFGLVYLNEFGVASAAFILQCSNVAETKKWLDSFRKAKVSFRFCETDCN